MVSYTKSNLIYQKTFGNLKKYRLSTKQKLNTSNKQTFMYSIPPSSHIHQFSNQKSKSVWTCVIISFIHLQKKTSRKNSIIAQQRLITNQHNTKLTFIKLFFFFSFLFFCLFAFLSLFPTQQQQTVSSKSKIL